MGEIDRGILKEFVSKIPDFLRKDQEEQFIAFGYFVQEVIGDPMLGEPDFTACYDTLDLHPPKNIDEYLNSMAIKKLLIDKGHRTYWMSGIVVEEFQKKYGIVPIKKPPKVKVKDVHSMKNINEELSKFLILHKQVTDVSKDLFLNGHYPQAIFEAVKVLEQEIRLKSGINDKIGVDLVNHVFSESNPILKIVDGNNIEHVDERDGFRFILVGIFRGIKNPQSHSIQELNDPTKALEYLALMSIMLKKVQDSKR